MIILVLSKPVLISGQQLIELNKISNIISTCVDFKHFYLTVSVSLSRQKLFKDLKYQNAELILVFVEKNYLQKNVLFHFLLKIFSYIQF